MTPVITRPPATVRSTTLYFREGSSDKVYHAAIEAQGNGHTVTFAYGRRGSTMNTGTKTAKPVSLAEATTVYDKLVASKTAKGYTPGEDGTPHAGTGNEGADTGVRCQLANPTDEAGARACIASHLWCAQEKFDGRRMLVRKDSGGVTGINRRGLAVALPTTVALAAAALPGAFLLDGEAVGDTLHAFDLLELDGRDLRKLPSRERLEAMEDFLGGGPAGAIRPVPTCLHPWEKEDLWDNLRSANREGVVFKRLDSPYSAGRPASGGDWLKFKFVETASFVAGKANKGKRSVALFLLDDAGNRVPAGNVTIPPNHGIPIPGTVVDLRYLYAIPESGSVYQPVYLGPRSDIPADECFVTQLKFKPDATAGS